MDNLLLETNENLLLETGGTDVLLLESAVAIFVAVFQRYYRNRRVA